MSARSLSDAGWLSLSGAARYACLSRDALRCAIARRELPAYVKPPRADGGRMQYRVSRSDIDEWMRSQPSAREAMLDAS